MLYLIIQKDLVLQIGKKTSIRVFDLRYNEKIALHVMYAAGHLKNH